MRKRSLASLFAIVFLTNILTGTAGFAQVSVSVGPKIGASFSGLRGEDAADVIMRKGFAGGLFLTISPLQFLAIQTEVLFQQKGAVNENEEFGYREDIKIDYINLPLLVKLRIPIFRTIFPNVYAGPQFSYMLKSDYTINTLDKDEITQAIDFKDFEFGGVFGAGMDVEVKHLIITVDFRYGLSAMNLINDEEIDLKNKDMAALFGVGYKF